MPIHKEGSPQTRIKEQAFPHLTPEQQEEQLQRVISGVLRTIDLQLGRLNVEVADERARTAATQALNLLKRQLNYLASEQYLGYEIKTNMLADIQSSLIQIQTRILAVNNAILDLRDHCNEVGSYAKWRR